MTISEVFFKELEKDLDFSLITNMIGQNDKMIFFIIFLKK